MKLAALLFYYLVESIKVLQHLIGSKSFTLFFYREGPFAYQKDNQGFKKSMHLYFIPQLFAARLDLDHYRAIIVALNYTVVHCVDDFKRDAASCVTCCICLAIICTVLMVLMFSELYSAHS